MKLVCLGVAFWVLAYTADAQASKKCATTQIRCGTKCGGAFCESPKRCATAKSLERCEKVSKVCTRVLKACGTSGLQCKYNEACLVGDPCPGKSRGCTAGRVIHKCVPLPPEEYSDCETVVSLRCMPVKNNGLPRTQVVHEDAGRTWHQGEKCGVGYCPKDRVCTQVEEKSCVGQVEPCGDIDCPIGYACEEKAGCREQGNAEKCVDPGPDWVLLEKEPSCIVECGK